MKVTPQLLRIIREEIESIDYGVVKITVNKSGNYTEVSTERKTRVVKNPDDFDSSNSYHQG